MAKETRRYFKTELDFLARIIHLCVVVIEERTLGEVTSDEGLCPVAEQDQNTAEREQIVLSNKLCQLLLLTPCNETARRVLRGIVLENHTFLNGVQVDHLVTEGKNDQLLSQFLVEVGSAFYDWLVETTLTFKSAHAGMKHSCTQTRCIALDYDDTKSLVNVFFNWLDELPSNMPKSVENFETCGESNM